ncbi:MarR family transcriptional regulator [Pigmentiphaga soli]|uniref:MarR family transcriptional regulator n=1 Tax=Pigmentiphaga soli TaxID=1007095 RepID=A0ABP8HJP5_9BURK
MTQSDSSSDAQAQLQSAIERSALLGRPGFLIRRLHQVHGSLFLEETREFAITPVQYSLMTALSERGEMDQISLALQLGLERTSVAEVIPRLEARGLLSRRQSADDKRVKLVKLTRKGRALVVKMAPAVQRAHDRTIEAIPPGERAQFMLQLIRLVEAGGDYGVPLALP